MGDYSLPDQEGLSNSYLFVWGREDDARKMTEQSYERVMWVEAWTIGTRPYIDSDSPDNCLCLMQRVTVTRLRRAGYNILAENKDLLLPQSTSLGSF